jgi:hypothetical protein
MWTSSFDIQRKSTKTKTNKSDPSSIYHHHSSCHRLTQLFSIFLFFLWCLSTIEEVHRQLEKSFVHQYKAMTKLATSKSCSLFVSYSYIHLWNIEINGCLYRIDIHYCYAYFLVESVRSYDCFSINIDSSIVDFVRRSIETTIGKPLMPNSFERWKDKCQFV